MLNNNNILLLIIILILVVFCYKYNFKNKDTFLNTKKFFTTNNLYIITKIFKASCYKLGLKYNITNNNKITIYHNNKSITFNKLFNNIHNPAQKYNATYKPQTSLLLRTANLSAPNYNVFNIPKTDAAIQQIIKQNKIAFPSVIKPVDGTGGNNVFVNIKNKEELKNILKLNIQNNLSFSKSNKLMIEDFIAIASYHGSDHRILCYKNIVLDVIQRKSAYIIGNGINTIKELVSMANKLKQKKNHYNIKINKTYIKKKGFNENDILKKNKKLVVYPISNFHQGGFLKRIPLSKIHHDNLNMFKKVNSILNLQLCGIDFLIKDITKSYKEQESAINEVNSSPNFDIHYYSNIKKGYNIPIKFLKLYFNIK